MIQEEGFGLGPGLGSESIHQKGEIIREEGFRLGPGLDNRCLFENKHPVSCYLCPDIYFLASEWNALNSDDKHPASCFLFSDIYFLASEWNALNSDDKHPASCFLFPGIRMENIWISLNWIGDRVL